MDVIFKDDNYQFILRTSALIFNEKKNKILLFYAEGRDFYMLPGGKIERLDISKNSLLREMTEELGEDYSNINFEFLGVSEELVNDKGYDNHQINIIYKGVYNKEIEKNKFKGLEGDWINFEWVEIKDIDNIDMFPKNIKSAIKNPNDKYHFIENYINKLKKSLI